MSKKKLKPFHESILDQLKTAEERLSKNRHIGLFVSRFVTEVQTITKTIKNTPVPQDKVETLIESLQQFYAEFESKYPISEDACGGKRERKQISECFTSTITDLQKR
jgi:hypothetical protein